MKRILALALLSGGLVSHAVSARGASTGFCLAADFGTRQAYLTSVFAASIDRRDLEAWFLSTLRAHGIDMPFAQCPRQGDRIAASAARAHAELFLRDLASPWIR